MYPYVGKLVANLTLAQLKTLDCQFGQVSRPVLAESSHRWLLALAELSTAIDIPWPQAIDST